MTLTEQASALLKLRGKKERAETRLKAMKDEMETLQQAIFDRMVAEGFEKIMVDNHYIAPQIKTHVSFSEEQEPAVFAALRSRKLDELIIDSVRKREFNKWVGDVQEEHMGTFPDWMKEVFSIYDKQTLSVRKAPKPKTVTKKRGKR